MTIIKTLSVYSGSVIKNDVEHKKWTNIGTVNLDKNGREYILINKIFNPSGVMNSESSSIPLIDNTGTIFVSVREIEKEKQ